MMVTAQHFNTTFTVLAVSVIAVLGGCADGVEVNGKLADLLGVSSAALAAKSAEPKLAARPGLVLPPDASRLPEPGSADDSNTALASVVDPDKKRAATQTERARLHKAYCSGEMNWKERAADPNFRPSSPYGSCSIAADLIK